MMSNQTPTLKDRLVDGTLFIDNSSLEVYNECRRKFKHSFIDKRILDGSQAALNYGSAIHIALEEYYKGVSIEKCLKLLEKHFEENPQPIEEWRSLSMAMEQFVAYTREYQGESMEVMKIPDSSDPNKLNHAVELPFAIPLMTWQHGDLKVPVVWTGKIDIICKFSDDRIFTVDHKTASMCGPTYWDDFTNSQPQIGYVWAARVASGLTIEGFMINVLVGRKPSRSGQKLDFQRQRYNVTDDQMAEWHIETCAHISDLLEDAFVKERWLMHRKSCVGKYFNRCPYMDVCSVDRDQRAGVLWSNLYKHNDWSPLR